MHIATEAYEIHYKICQNKKTAYQTPIVMKIKC